MDIIFDFQLITLFRLKIYYSSRGFNEFIQNNFGNYYFLTNVINRIIN